MRFGAVVVSIIYKTIWGGNEPGFMVTTAEFALNVGAGVAASPIEALFEKKPELGDAYANEHLTRYTADVMAGLIRRFAAEPAQENARGNLEKLAGLLPGIWPNFQNSLSTECRTLNAQRFVQYLGEQIRSPEPIPLEPFANFFRSIATENELTGLIRSQTLDHLDAWLAQHLGTALQTVIVSDLPEATTAYKKTLLRFHSEHQEKLKALSSQLSGVDQRSEQGHLISHQKLDILIKRSPSKKSTRSTRNIAKPSVPSVSNLLQGYVELERKRYDPGQFTSTSRITSSFFLPVEEMYMVLPLIMPGRSTSQKTSPSTLQERKGTDLTLSQMGGLVSVVHSIEGAAQSEPESNEYKIMVEDPVSELLKPESRTVVLGGPGSGKSTLLKYITHSRCATYAKNEPSLLPLLFRCESVKTYPVLTRFADLLKHHFKLWDFSSQQIDELVLGIEQLLEKGQVALLVDGINEIYPSEKLCAFAKLLSSVAIKYPRSIIIVTSRTSEYPKIEDKLESQFTKSELKPLSRSVKEEFVKKWGALHEWDVARIEKVTNLVCDKHSIATLTDRIFLLWLVVQNSDKPEPNNEFEIYESTIEWMLEKGNSAIKPPLEWNELVPYLGFLAFKMKLERLTQILDEQAEEVFAILHSLNFKKEVPPQRKNLLNLCMSPINLLSVVGKKRRGGLRQNLLEFFHPSFQDHFASYGIADGPNLARFKELLPLLESEENKGDMPGDNKFLEPVFADSWQETIRKFIAGLPAKVAGDAIDLLLPDKNTPSRDHRPRSVFALECLAVQPKVSENVEIRVFDAVIDNLSDTDCLYTENKTSMDRSLVAIGDSSFSGRFQMRLLNEFVNVNGDRRMRVGLAYLKVFPSDKGLLEKDQIEDTIDESFQGMRSMDASTRVKTALRLTDLFFLHDGKLAYLEPDYRSQFVEILMLGLSSDPGTVAASMWALGWFTGATKRKGKSNRVDISDTQKSEFVTLSSEPIERIEFLIRSNQWDERFWSRALLLLTRDAKMVPVGAQIDWIYNLALVADGDVPRHSISIINPPNHCASREWIRLFLGPSYSLKTNINAAIALGSFAIFCPEMGEALWACFEDTSQPEDLRDEALVYLALLGNDFARDKIETAADTDPIDKENEYLYLRGVFGLLLLDDVELLAKQIEKALPHADLSAYAFGLAGSRNPRGMEILIRLKGAFNE